MTASRPEQAPFFLDPRGDILFPDVSLAMTDPNGLLAIGGDLSEQRILTAYRSGIFPWYSADQPILWWSPDPRAVLYLDQLQISRSLRKTLRRREFTVTLDHAFPQVMMECAKSRKDGRGTWITQAMFNAYVNLHQKGYAHSVEIWHNDRLAGGLYGVSIGKVFFGESMFTRVTDASKVALVYLVHQLKRWQFAFIDCQVQSEHLDSLGAITIPRDRFIDHLSKYASLPDTLCGTWQIDADLITDILPS